MKQRSGTRSDWRRLLVLWLAPALWCWACEPASPEPPPRPADGAAPDRGSGGNPAGGAGGSGGAAGGSGPGSTGGAGGRAAQPDGGGSRPDADGGAPTQDGSPAAGDIRPALDGGGPPSAALDQRCTVPITYRNQAMGAEGGRIFDTAIPDVTAAMQAHARAICRILYRKPEEVKNVRQQGLTVEPQSAIAFAAGSNITFSTNYIASFARGKSQAVINDELNGVLVHEGTHVWQYTNGGGALVEAMADYVRFKAGYYTLARRRPGGNWDQPYTTGGFFIAWIEERYDPDFGYKVNMGMRDRGFSYPAFVQQITGKSVDAVWTEYQAAIR
jgi:hypothetical protein